MPSLNMSSQIVHLEIAAFCLCLLGRDREIGHCHLYGQKGAVCWGQGVGCCSLAGPLTPGGECNGEKITSPSIHLRTGFVQVCCKHLWQREVLFCSQFEN